MYCMLNAHLFFRCCSQLIIYSMLSSVSIFHYFAWQRSFGILYQILFEIQISIGSIGFIIIENRISNVNAKYYNIFYFFFLLYIVDSWHHLFASKFEMRLWFNIIIISSLFSCLCQLFFRNSQQMCDLYVQCAKVFKKTFYCKRRQIHDNVT